MAMDQAGGLIFKMAMARGARPNRRERASYRKLLHLLFTHFQDLVDEGGIEARAQAGDELHGFALLAVGLSD